MDLAGIKNFLPHVIIMYCLYTRLYYMQLLYCSINTSTYVCFSVDSGEADFTITRVAPSLSRHGNRAELPD